MLNRNHSILMLMIFQTVYFTQVLTFIPRLWFVLCNCYSRVELHIKSHLLKLFYFQDLLSGTSYCPLLLSTYTESYASILTSRLKGSQGPF